MSGVHGDVDGVGMRMGIGVGMRWDGMVMGMGGAGVSWVPGVQRSRKDAGRECGTR